MSLILLIAVIFMDLAIPRLIQKIIDQGITPRDMHIVTSTTLLMLGISVAQMLFAIGNNILSIQVGEGVARDLRDALFLKIQSFSFGNLDRMNTGQLMVRLSSDTTIFQRMVQVSLRIGTRAPLLMIGSLVLMFRIDSRLALVMVPILLATSLVIGFFIMKMEPLFRNVQAKLDQLNIALQENIAGVRLVRAFVRAEHENRRFAQTNEDYTRNAVQAMQFMSTLSPAISIFVNAGIVAVIWMGGIQAISANMSIGQLVAFINYLQTTLGPLTLMIMLANVAAAGTASAERIVEILETIPDVQDEAQPLTLPEAPLPRIVFENISFHYNESGDDEVLKGINLVIEPGQTLAILGATGAGKSSLVNLLPRFYEPSTGKITLNGLDICRVRQEVLREHIGIVPQEIVLFSGTVRDNIRYGLPTASEEQVIAAARIAQADEFITNLPQGYNTHIAERGVNLSGGQKQRIAIARALLRNPSILILDDSTSSVDIATETAFQSALKVWMQTANAPRICLVVAQRVSTVLNADKIIVLDQGHITAEGTHNELIQSSQIYQDIYASQLGNGFESRKGQAHTRHD